MNDRDPHRAEAILQIGRILAAVYLRLRFPAPVPSPPLDCPETKSESCDGRLTP